MNIKELADKIQWTENELRELLTNNFPEVSGRVPSHIKLAIICLADVEEGAKELDKIQRFGRSELLGQKFISTQGIEYEVVERTGPNSYKVDFGNYQTEQTRQNIHARTVKNPMHPHVKGVGCFGVGPFNSADPRYNRWVYQMSKAAKGEEIDPALLNFQTYCKRNPL